MPELPEVETIRRSLEKVILGKRIHEVKIRVPRLRYPIDSNKIIPLLCGQRIEKIERRSKYLLIHLQSSNCLIIHLGMSGQLLMLPLRDPLTDHDHVLFLLDNELQLRFRDPRRFGLVDVLEKEEISTHKYFEKMGVEPLSKACNGLYLFKKSRGLKKPVKNFLMDSHQIAGIGNIYANEALYLAGIRPTKPVGQLNLYSWKKLTRSFKQVLRNAIKKGGTTINDFINSNGEKGYFQVSLKIYGKEGEPCSQCEKRIRRKVLAGRSTFYCPSCQI